MLAAILAIAPGFCAHSQEAARSRPLDLFDIGAPALTAFSARDGVPESAISSIQTDRDGFVWLASAKGLARYDGVHWNADPPAVEGSLGALMLARDGTLWSAFRDLGVARYDGTAWHFENRNTGFPSDHARRLVETVDGRGKVELWAPTFDAGLLLRDGARWIPGPRSAQLPRGVLSVARTTRLGGHERLWVGTFNEGLWFREDGDWQRFREDGFDPAQVEHLVATSHAGREELWIATFGSGLWRLAEDGTRSWSMVTGELPTDELYEIAESGANSSDRAIWVASRAGLIRIHDDRAVVFDRRYGLPSNVVRSVNVWRSASGVDVLWLATENGVARSVVGANQWLTASLMGARGSGIFGILVEPDGKGEERVWIAASADGLGLYEDGHWREFSQSNRFLPEVDARLIKRAPDDNGQSALWLGQRNGFLLRVREGPSFELIATPWEQHPGQAVMDVIGRKVNGMWERWFATRQSGLYRSRGGVWTQFRPAGVVGQWRAVRLLEQIDAAGGSWLWATSNQGLARFDGEQWTLVTGLPDSELSGLSLIPDDHGRPILWIGSGHEGIIRVDVGDPRKPAILAADLPRPPDPTAYGALRDTKGNIYICTNVGVQQLTPGAQGYVSRVFTRRDGMVNDECNTNAQFIDAHDRYWTGTLGGAAVFDPARGALDEAPKPLRLTGIRIDGNVVDTSSGLRVAPGQHDLRIDFALLSWQRETESRFRTHLLGYEDEAGPWTAQNFRDFTTLPAGDYKLRIEARDYAGNASTPIDVAIEVVPRWWQRQSATAGLVLSALLLGYGALRWRLRSLHRQRGRLADQVAERTSELHAANARLLELSYKDALTGLANRRALLEALQAATEKRMRVALILVDVDHFKDYNDHFGHPAGDEALCCVAQAMLQCVPAETLVARYGGEEFACVLLDADLAQAIALAENIRSAVAVRDVSIPATAIINHVTISAGVFSQVVASDDDAHRLLREADNALYRAKNDGRNCVCT